MICVGNDTHELKKSGAPSAVVPVIYDNHIKFKWYVLVMTPMYEEIRGAISSGALDLWQSHKIGVFGQKFGTKHKIGVLEKKK